MILPRGMRGSRKQPVCQTLKTLPQEVRFVKKVPVTLLRNTGGEAEIEGDPTLSSSEKGVRVLRL